MASQAILIENDAFSRLKEMYPAVQPYEMNGYLYLTVKEKDGWVTYRTNGPRLRYLYQARRVITAGAGGTLTATISAAAGQTMTLVQAYAKGPASAGAALVCNRLDEDGNTAGYLGNEAAGAAREMTLPVAGPITTAHASYGITLGMIFGPGESLYFGSGVCLQTETLTVHVVLLLTTNVEPTWTAGGTGTPTMAASTISAANTMQAVVLP